MKLLLEMPQHDKLFTMGTPRQLHDKIGILVLAAGQCTGCWQCIVTGTHVLIYATVGKLHTVEN